MEQKRLLHLKEWEPAELDLTPSELVELQSLAAAKLMITPGPAPGRYVVRPSSIVGSATSRRLEIVIEPKLGIDRLFFLLGYARRLPFVHEAVDLSSRDELTEAFAASFLTVLHRALRRGLLMGYVRRDEALPLVRGRIRFADQTRRHYGLPLPVEVSFDDYTVDTDPNRLVKAALRRLSYLHLRRAETRKRIREALAAFDGVSDITYDRRRLPAFKHDRLTERYRVPLELARLILQNTAVELGPGGVSTAAILLDMNDVFEDFLFAAVGEGLRAGCRLTTGGGAAASSRSTSAEIFALSPISHYGGVVSAYSSVTRSTSSRTTARRAISTSYLPTAPQPAWQVERSSTRTQ